MVIKLCQCVVYKRQQFHYDGTLVANSKHANNRACSSTLVIRGVHTTYRSQLFDERIAMNY